MYWSDVIEKLEIAFQPVVDVRTGLCFAAEAFVRGVDRAGFPSIDEFLDASHRLGLLARTDEVLVEMALAAFHRFAAGHPVGLFINVDARTIAGTRDILFQVSKAAGRHGMAAASVIVDVSGHGSIDPGVLALETSGMDRTDLCGLAIHGFAEGALGLPFLYHARPNFVKISRSFIVDMVGRIERKEFVRQIVHVARMAGARVIAVGVETEQESRVCREVGCDFIQGRLLQEPTPRVEELQDRYHVEGMSVGNNVSARRGRRPLDDQIEVIVPIHDAEPMDNVFERFRREGRRSFFPVTRSTGEPVGLVVEEKLKEYAYSRFGKDLISNKMFGHRLMEFVIPCPTADIGETPEKVLEIFSRYDSTLGILIVENGVYVGFLHAHMLLRIIQERNVARARDENPLTRLPGNNAINEYIEKALADVGTEHNVAYFDFDNFKPFNLETAVCCALPARSGWH
ncbi:MAG: EAL domain-containing protein, partial [Alphaproteobacteria bacterium]|nr:EAL domain-containing protein [Alphaproteobacteria bacterium]